MANDHTRPGAKGFSGLDALLSGSEEAPQAERHTEQPAPQSGSHTKAQKSAGAPPSIVQVAPETETFPGASPAASVLRRFGWLITITAVLVGVVAISNMPANSPPAAPVEDSAARAAPPITPQTVVIEDPAARSAPAAAAETVVIADGEEMPRSGERGVLTAAETRWCVYEKWRLSAMKEFASEGAEIAAFNGFIDRYNAHCAKARYRVEYMESIEKEINTEGRRLQAEGVERVLSIRSSTQSVQTADPVSSDSSANSSPAGNRNEAVATPNTILERLRSTAPTAVDVQILWREFGLFNAPQSGKPAFEISSTVPLREGQGYGWVIQLHTAKPKVTWREELVLPARPTTLTTGPGTTVSSDGLTVTTEREVAPSQGFIHHAWSVAIGDPKGPHTVRVYVEGTLAHPFHFTAE